MTWFQRKKISTLTGAFIEERNDCDTMFIVTDEYAGSGDMSLGIFTSKEKALQAFNKCLEDNDNHEEWIKIKDEDTNKEYFYTDGSYGWTVRLKEFPKNEMNSIW